jgi:glycosyltransferase involved in cell wall biosynthesis
MASETLERRAPSDQPPEAAPSGRARRALVVAPQPFYTDRGTPIAVRYVLEALSQLGWQADLLTFPCGAEVSIPNVRILRVPNPLGLKEVPIGFSLPKLALDGLMAARLRSLLRDGAYDVVHGVEEGALLLTAQVGRGGPALVYDMASSLPEQLTQKRALRIPPLPALFRAIEAKAVRRAGCVICSAGLEAQVRRISPQTPCRTWRFPATAPVVSESAQAALRQEHGIGADDKVLLYGGSFASYQGVDLLLEALPRIVAAHPQALLLLVGAPDEATARRCREAAGPAAPRVRVLTRRPREDLAALTTLARILLSPRRYGGNLPLKIFDYLAVGRPIVATDIPTHRSILDQRLARLVPPTAKGLAQGIIALLDDPAQAAALGEAGRLFALEALSWESFRALIADIYETALARPMGTRAAAPAGP